MIFISMHREDYLNLVSIVRAHGLHKSPRVSLAALRCAHASPAPPCASSRSPPETKPKYTGDLLQGVWHLQPSGSHEQGGAAREDHPRK